MDASVVSPARRDSLRAAVWGWWVAARGDQRLTYLVGAGLILIGLAQVDLLDASTCSPSWSPHGWAA